MNTDGSKKHVVIWYQYLDIHSGARASIYVLEPLSFPIICFPSLHNSQLFLQMKIRLLIASLARIDSDRPASNKPLYIAPSAPASSSTAFFSVFEVRGAILALVYVVHLLSFD